MIVAETWKNLSVAAPILPVAVVFLSMECLLPNILLSIKAYVINAVQRKMPSRIGNISRSCMSIWCIESSENRRINISINPDSHAIANTTKHILSVKTILNRRLSLHAKNRSIVKNIMIIYNGKWNGFKISKSVKLTPEYMSYPFIVNAQCGIVIKDIRICALLMLMRMIFW